MGDLCLEVVVDMPSFLLRTLLDLFVVVVGNGYQVEVF